MTVVVALIASAAGIAEVSDTVRLTVQVEGLRSDNGQVAAALFDSPEAYDDRSAPVRQAMLTIEDRSCTWVVPDLPPGTYAVALYHDRNGNGMLDRKALGIPKEPYGFSNNPTSTFGPPSFDRAKFVLEDRDVTIGIRLRGAGG